MEDVLHQVLDEDVLIFLVGGTIAITAIVFGFVSSTVKGVAREKTRREIAAYIAEGSMTADQGEKLMKAQPDDD
ncbi:MAG: hypothetical protein AAFX79_04230 [Planctomycetota bacterium]